VAQWINSLPVPPWFAKDIGTVAREGSSAISKGVFAVSGAGNDIAGPADEFHFLYQKVTNNLQVVARLLAQQSTNSLAQAGLMIRDSEYPGGRYGMVAQVGATESSFQRRLLSDAPSAATAGPAGQNPRWLKLVREAQRVAAYVSADSEAWTEVGSDIAEWGPESLVGLAVTSRDPYAYNIGRFDNVGIITGSLISPNDGASYGLPARIRLAAEIPVGGNLVSKVEFYTGTILIGECLAPPYELLWTNALSGEQVVRAVITDRKGNSFSTSTARIELLPAAAVVSSRPKDPVVKGDWVNNYGKEGYLIAGAATNLPLWIRATLDGASEVVWEETTLDPRGLTRPQGEGRVAAAWTATNTFR
jgi:hypothetical protein